MMQGRFFQFILLLIIGFCGYYLIITQSDDLVQLSPNIELPQFSARNIINTSYDLKGIRNYRIESEQLDHYAKSGDTVFQNITLFVFKKSSQAEWHIVSDKGILDKDQRLILTGNVLAKNLLPESSFDTMLTDELIIQLESKDFHSDVQVTLTGPLFTNIGQAMTGNLNTNQAKLFNQVKGIYEQAP